MTTVQYGAHRPNAQGPGSVTQHRGGLSRLWDRELDHYPSNGPRYTSLGIVVLTTVILYYQLYLAGGVATQILTNLHMSFVFYVNVSVVGYVLGAAASVVAGLADRYGRANIVTAGLAVTGLLCAVALPNVHSKLGFAVVYIAIGFVEGIILVATPALVRDFSPQLGRASAMGFWTLGPVLGSLVVSAVVSNSSADTSWQHQYRLAGIAGLVVFAIALLGLRELSPGMRDQLMVSSKDRELIEARAAGIDPEAITHKPFRQMLHADILGSAFAISVFLIIYYIAVGFFPIFFETVFGYSSSKANALGNWFWSFDALGLLIVGVISDRLRVRKPFMIVGALGAAVTTTIFALSATHPATSYSTFVVLLSLIAVFLGMSFAPWMASFTETVERRNPALIATGLAVWGLTIRVVIAASVFFVPLVVTTATTLVQQGPVAQGLAAQYAPQLATAAKVDPATLAALSANPKDQAAGIKAVSEISGVSAADVIQVATISATDAAQIQTAQAIDSTTQITLATNPTDTAAQAKAIGEIVTTLKVSQTEAVTRLQALGKVPVTDLLAIQTNGPKVQSATTELTALASIPASDTALLQKVQKAASDSPSQWRTYFFVGVAGELLFIPLIFLMAGFWSPRKAKQAEQAHMALIEREMAELRAS